MITYLDASAVIHAGGDSPTGSALRSRIEAAASGRFAISPLVRLEALVRPMRTADRRLMRNRMSLLDRCVNLGFDERTFDLALHIRAQHNFSTPDAMHLAVAGQRGCDKILTGDRKILQALPGFAVDIAESF